VNCWGKRSEATREELIKVVEKGHYGIQIHYKELRIEEQGGATQGGKHEKQAIEEGHRDNIR